MVSSGRWQACTACCSSPPPATMTQPFDKRVNLKLLYTFDDANTFLARSVVPITAKIITLPNQPPHNGAQIGCVSLRSCLELLQSISPEWFQKGMDYSIYYKDIIESGEPYVALGLCSNILAPNMKSSASNVSSQSLLVTGRLCTNFLNLYQPNSSADTLDIKLRLSPLPASSISHKRNIETFHSFPSYSEPHHHNQQLAPPIHHHQSMIPSPSQNAQQAQPPRKKSKKQQGQQSSALPPQLAARTQSLPFMTEDSLAHRIRVSDMLSKVNEEVDSNGEPISSRFSNFSKKSTMDDDSQPTKAKKTKSFSQSVVKIGDSTTKSQSQKVSISIKRCVNCLTEKNPPYKFFKDGIFEMANAGYLCSTCSSYQSNNNMKDLRERGRLGSRGLLDGPYASNVLQTSKPRRTTKRKNNNTNNTNNLSSSSIITSSSPMIGSSPMALTTVAASRRKPQHQNQLLQQQQSLNMTMGPSVDYTSTDLMDLLKLDSNFASTTSNINTNSNSNSNNNGLDAIEDMFRVPTSKFPGSSYSASSQSSKGNTPEDYYKDIDNVPVDAMKLNTTLIPLEDDAIEENKENYPPLKTSLKPIQETSFISPSIQRIIDSFSAAADSNGQVVNDDQIVGSPTKENHDWNYDFFQEHEKTSNTKDDSDYINTSQVDALHTECDDPEINRILGINSASASTSTSTSASRKQEEEPEVEITPRDPGTNTQQQDSPSHPETQVQTQTTQSKQQVQAKGNTNLVKHLSKQKQSMSNTTTTMPSSPFFQISHDDDADEKTADTTLATMAQWATASSPVTDPVSDPIPEPSEVRMSK